MDRGVIEMRFIIISVGKVRESYLRAGMEDFLKRLRPYASIEYIEGLEEKTPPRPTAGQVRAVMERESQRVLSQVKEGDCFIALDSRGDELTSEGMASLVETLGNARCSRIVVAIGGSHGFTAELLNRADYTLSLSRLTFPHQMTVLIFLEQLYRSFKILKGEPYHK